MVEAFKRFPLICPKGKRIFFKAEQVASCWCKARPKSCKRMKRKVNDYILEVMGVGYVVVGRNLLGKHGSNRIFL